MSSKDQYARSDDELEAIIAEATVIVEAKTTKNAQEPENGSGAGASGGGGGGGGVQADEKKQAKKKKKPAHSEGKGKKKKPAHSDGKEEKQKRKSVDRDATQKFKPLGVFTDAHTSMKIARQLLKPWPKTRLEKLLESDKKLAAKRGNNELVEAEDRRKKKIAEQNKKEGKSCGPRDWSSGDPPQSWAERLDYRVDRLQKTAQLIRWYASEKNSIDPKWLVTYNQCKKRAEALGIIQSEIDEHWPPKEERALIICAHGDGGEEAAASKKTDSLLQEVKNAMKNKKADEKQVQDQYAAAKAAKEKAKAADVPPANPGQACKCAAGSEPTDTYKMIVNAGGVHTCKHGVPQRTQIDKFQFVYMLDLLLRRVLSSVSKYTDEGSDEFLKPAQFAALRLARRALMNRFIFATVGDSRTCDFLSLTDGADCILAFRRCRVAERSDTKCVWCATARIAGVVPHLPLESWIPQVLTDKFKVLTNGSAWTAQAYLDWADGAFTLTNESTLRALSVRIRQVVAFDWREGNQDVRLVMSLKEGACTEKRRLFSLTEDHEHRLREFLLLLNVNESANPLIKTNTDARAEFCEYTSVYHFVHNIIAAHIDRTGCDVYKCTCVREYGFTASFPYSLFVQKEARYLMKGVTAAIHKALNYKVDGPVYVVDGDNKVKKCGTVGSYELLPPTYRPLLFAAAKIDPPDSPPSPVIVHRKTRTSPLKSPADVAAEKAAGALVALSDKTNGVGAGGGGGGADEGAKVRKDDALFAVPAVSARKRRCPSGSSDNPPPKALKANDGTKSVPLESGDAVSGAVRPVNKLRIGGNERPPERGACGVDADLPPPARPAVTCTGDYEDI